MYPYGSALAHKDDLVAQGVSDSSFAVLWAEKLGPYCSYKYLRKENPKL